MSLTLETDWLIRVCLSRLALCRASLVPVLVPVNLVGKGRPCPCFRDFSLEPWSSAVAAFMATHGGPCDYREIRSEGLLVQEGFGCCDAGCTACCDEVGLAPLVRGFAHHALSLLGRCCIGWLLAVLRLSGFSATRVLLCRAMLDLTSGL